MCFLILAIVSPLFALGYLEKLREPLCELQKLERREQITTSNLPPPIFIPRLSLLLITIINPTQKYEDNQYFHHTFTTIFSHLLASIVFHKERRWRVVSGSPRFFFVVEKRQRLALWCKTVNCLRLQHDSKGKLMDLKGQSSAREPWHKRCGHNCL